MPPIHGDDSNPHEVFTRRLPHDCPKKQVITQDKCDRDKAVYDGTDRKGIKLVKVGDNFCNSAKGIPTNHHFDRRVHKPANSHDGGAEYGDVNEKGHQPRRKTGILTQQRAMAVWVQRFHRNYLPVTAAFRRRILLDGDISL